ncbi:hypothetical protein CHLNCDRAFT_28922 [Chlorella variabilis]|uniref:JmjC domain-containing protein n=1 Tax=Chlorella variabilis TaxID=554065 RepID=E1ZU69_CHLVA|nr:hypothetical protein CHLNCDRAFT_28922 [Chlorella variabilis]EFN50624.1 hypothetical protein CHLNCDRAFT_28922 [Chlorella variabilis]|eukprot:XP_005842744.1 hypothetical protein CHLNCDRAFT_28922 [Chlorella variabilis]
MCVQVVLTAGDSGAPPPAEPGLAPAAETSSIPRLPASELSYARFCLEFMEPNAPVLVEGATEGWRAAVDWVTPCGAIDFDFLRQHFGHAQVMVTDAARCECQQQQQQQQQEEEEEEMRASSTLLTPGPLWYCKDWHLAAFDPQYQAYHCPSFFDDWLNELYDAREQPQPQHDVRTADYRFVYLGAKGTSTSLHSDVLRSFSWSANVVGCKLWRLLPPQARSHIVTVVQHPGDAIFVPSGWWHTVENVDDCISINHNWLNGHNVHWTWALLRLERRQAEEGIEDCRELCRQDRPSPFFRKLGHFGRGR